MERHVPHPMIYMDFSACTARMTVLTAIMAAFAPVLCSEVLDHFNPLSEDANGVHFYGATLSGMYSNGLGGGLGLNIPVGPRLPGAVRITTLQGSAALGWSKNADKSFVSVRYSPSYVRGVSGAQFDSTNHTGAIAFGRSFGAKWSLNGSANGILSDFNQLLFARTGYDTIASTPATFDEFVAAMLTGRSTNLALTQAVITTPVVASPEAAYQYGGRILSVSAGVSAGYSYSSRSSLTFGFSGVRSQFLDYGNNESTLPTGYAVPRTTSGSASVSWGYSLTPRTFIGANVSRSRIVSIFQDAYSDQAGISAGHILNRRWFVRANVGGGRIQPRRQTFQPTRGPQLTYGAGIGYKVYAHTFVASFSRSVADIYGLGASASENSGGAWAWKRPGRTYSFRAGFGHSRLISDAFPKTRSWNVFASAGKSLNSHFAATVSWSYTQFPATIFVASSDITRSGVMASLSWSPSVRR